MKSELGIKIINKLDLDKRLLLFPKEKKIAGELNLFDNRSGRTLYKAYLGKKIEYLLVVFVSMLFLMIITSLMPDKESHIENGMIWRNGYDEVEKNIVLVAKSEGMKEEIEISLEPVHYTGEQLTDMAGELFAYVEENILFDSNKNERGEIEIKMPLTLPSKVSGYPFLITWESSNYNILDSNGFIGEEVAEGGENVIITVKLSCYEHSYEKDFILRVFPHTKDWEENFSEVIKKAIEELDEKTAEEDSFLLPKEIDGHTISYEEKSENTWLVFLFLGIIAMIYVWFAMDSDLQKKIDERNRQLLSDYAKFVSKLSLYLGVGLSLETVIRRIVKKADKDRFYVKELEISLREMENHIPVSEAVEKFANRCRLPCYIKLSVLLNQNLKKGNNNIQRHLKEETKKAIEERENLARKYAQEAGTKLLFPMLLMLVVVMVMIMYPAFVSFTI